MNKNERYIINMIKYVPLIFIVLTSILVTFLLYIDKRNTLKDENNYIKTRHFKEKKLLIENEVTELHNIIKKTKEETEVELKQILKNRVNEAYNIAMSIYNENKATKSKKEIKKLIKDALRTVRFNNGRGYYYIYSFDYTCILLPINKKLEGSSFYNYQDIKGTYIARKIVKALENKKEAFLSWYYYKPENLKKHYKKIGFNKYFEPFDWYIGTGEYIIDYENDVKQDIINHLKKYTNSPHNYYFVIDYDKNILFHHDKKYFNKNIEEIKFFNDKKDIINDVISIAKEGSGFISYLSKDSKENIPKTIYVSGLPKWNWALGKVDYNKELYASLKEKEDFLNESFKVKLLQLIFINTLITLVLLVISRYISSTLEKKFTLYKKEIQEFVEERNKQQHIISQQSKMAAMGEMIGNIAHQWRQPLSIITTISSGIKLQKQLDSLSDESFYKSVDNINETAQYLSKTIDDFRNFYRSDKRETYFAINNTIEKALKLTSAQFKNHDIELQTQIEDFELFGLENEFLQVLINILNNSKDALEEKKYKRVIFIETFIKDHTKTIKIKDNAGGVKNDLFDKICDPYFTTKDISKGTGIGLYMSKEIVEEHMQGKFLLENIELEYKDEKHKGFCTTISFKTEPKK